MKFLFYTILLILLFVFDSHQAQAYLDPGSGSFLFQIIVGGLLSALFAIKLYFRKIKSFFSKKPKASNQNGQNKENN